MLQNFIVIIICVRMQFHWNRSTISIACMKVDSSDCLHANHCICTPNHRNKFWKKNLAVPYSVEFVQVVLSLFWLC